MMEGLTFRGIFKDNLLSTQTQLKRHIVMNNFTKIIGCLAFMFILCYLVIPVAAHSAEANESDKAAINETENGITSSSEAPEGMEARAVYYAKRYQGRRTSSGARFDHKKLTAAHPSLPLGTRVKVINTSNDRSVVVTINDRCRERSFELIDLTRAAASKLGFYGRKGTAKVIIIPLEKDQVAINTNTQKSASESEKAEQ